MRDDAVRAYVRAPLISAENELESLGIAFAENAFLFCADLAAGRVDHWELLPFCEYRAIPVYKYAYGGWCAFIAVEDDGSGDIRVSIMLACRVGKPVFIDGKLWDGLDMRGLDRDILAPRLRDYFI